MYKELSSDIEGFKLPDHGYLMGWAKQGERNVTWLVTWLKSLRNLIG